MMEHDTLVNGMQVNDMMARGMMVHGMMEHGNLPRMKLFFQLFLSSAFFHLLSVQYFSGIYYLILNL